MAPAPRYVQLEGGDKMPIVGFGTWQASVEEVEKATTLALEAGYRHIDAARAYDNEGGVGSALRAWLDKGGRREDLFICTKLPPTGNRPDLVKQFFEESLSLLGLDYVDLYLLHVPFGFQYVPGDLHPHAPDGSMLVDHDTDLVAIWKEMAKLKSSGRARNIGVSNMNPSQVARLSAAGERPACLQIELHAALQQRSLATECGLPLVAYSPLGSAALVAKLSADTGRSYPAPLQEPAVLAAAARLGRTPAQVLLRHTIERGIAVLPKSVTPQRIKENIDLFDFELSEEETKALDALDQGERGRICDFSFFKGVEKHPEFPFERPRAV